MSEDSILDVMEDLLEHDTDPKVPAAIIRTVEHIRQHTGLLGDYHDGVIQLAEGGSVIQWYARGRLFSEHDDLLQWIQLENDGVIIGVCGQRRHPNPESFDDDEVVPFVPYIEIHPKSRWTDDD